MEILYGHIYLVNFDPSVGSEYQKVRPALVIQSDEITVHSPLVTIIPISSRVEKKETDDILIPKDDKNRLLHTSVLKVHQISSFDRRRFIHRIGEVNRDIMNLVAIYLRKHFRL
ncbi:MAG TPA: type II toxin-antitoxin system PemK/MazF family toxin [Bacteroidota bacterium]|nr:type II toxin-antitoxin system PemK/MazF family toxin [Bacteroidota bacterium]